MLIRETTTNDADKLRTLYFDTFDESEAALVAQLAVDLLSDECTLSLVAEKDDLLGHVAFSPVRLEKTNMCIGKILAPLAVHPAHQKKGIGSQLVRKGLTHIESENLPLMFVYGDPNYYGRFGFSSDTANDYTPPCPLQFPHGWQAHLLPGKGPHEAGTLSCVPALSNPRLW